MSMSGKQLAVGVVSLAIGFTVGFLLQKRSRQPSEKKNPSNDQVEKLCRAALKGTENEIPMEAKFTIQDCSRGCDQWVKLISCHTIGEDGPSVYKFVFKMPSRERAKLAEEVLCTRIAFQLDIRAPRVFYCDMKEHGFLLESLIHGENMDDLTKPLYRAWSNDYADSQQTYELRCFASAYQELGQMTRRLHDHEKGYYGYFREHVADIENCTNRHFQNAYDFITCNKWAESIETKMTSLADKHLFTDNEIRNIKIWYEEHIHVLEMIEQPVLNHGDLDDSNIIMQIPEQGKRKYIIKGIIDWGDAGYGAAAEDLACMYIKHVGKWSWIAFFYIGYLGYKYQNGTLSPPSLEDCDVKSLDTWIDPETVTTFLEQIKVYAVTRLLWSVSADRQHEATMLRAIANEPRRREQHEQHH